MTEPNSGEGSGESSDGSHKGLRPDTQVPTTVPPSYCKRHGYPQPDCEDCREELSASAAALKAPPPDTEPLRARDTAEFEQAIYEFQWAARELGFQIGCGIDATGKERHVAEVTAARQALLSLFSRSTAPQELEQLRADAERWRMAVQIWSHRKLRPPQVHLDDGNDCYDTFAEAVDARIAFNAAALLANPTPARVEE